LAALPPESPFLSSMSKKSRKNMEHTVTVAQDTVVWIDILGYL
jgi:hypothetical protein